MHEKGFSTMHKIQGCLEKLPYPFFFDMGTLLGIVREGKLLGHDLDIDVAVRIQTETDKEKLTQTLTSQGCKLKYEFTVDGLGIVEQSYLCNGIKFDINYYYRENKTDVCYLMYSDKNSTDSTQMKVVKLTCRAIDTIVQREVGEYQVNIPENAEQYLAQRYGESWRIPDKNYVYWKGPSTTPTNLIGRRKIIDKGWK